MNVLLERYNSTLVPRLGHYVTEHKQDSDSYVAL